MIAKIRWKWILFVVLLWSAISSHFLSRSNATDCDVRASTRSTRVDANPTMANLRASARSDDPSVQWIQANPLAIEMDASANAWHSGRVNDVLALDSGLLVGTDTGGVWAITTAGGAIPLSNDWDVPNVKSLAFGPDGNRHVYAGCSATNGMNGPIGNGALYETDTSDQLPMIRWRQIPIPAGTGDVYRVAVLGTTRRIVIACANGVWWSAIPPSPTAKGTYTWRPAQGLMPGPYSGLAIGPNDSVAVAAGQGGISYGDWANGNLVMTQASFSGSDVTGSPINAGKLCWTSMASCDTNRMIMYAISGGCDDFVYAVLRSQDGGKSWSSLGTSVDDMLSGSQFKFLPGNQANGWNNTIAVSSRNPDVVAFGLRKGPFISTNAGRTWRVPSMFPSEPNKDKNTLDFRAPHQHADIHVVYFDPNDPLSQRLYVGSDGGLAVSSDLGATFTSELNRNLLCLQFFPNALTTNETGDLIGGGTQDNGNLYSLSGQESAWRELDAGNDGGIMRLLQPGQLLRYSNTHPVMQVATRNSQNQFTSDVDIPVRRKGPSGLEKLDKPVVEIIPSPTFRNKSNHLMYAVAGRNAEVYGLFAVAPGADLFWEYLGPVPVGGTSYINAVGSANGLTIFVGTSEGRLFAFDSQSGTPLELNIPIEPRPAGSIGRIVVESTSKAYATYNRGPLGFILRLDGFRWNAIAFADGNFTALELDRKTKTIFAANDSRVFVSRDNGDNWQSASQGLPRRPHCSDLRYVAQPDGARFLYLSTYGRSVWRARL